MAQFDVFLIDCDKQFVKKKKMSTQPKFIEKYIGHGPVKCPLTTGDVWLTAYRCVDGN